MAFYSQQSTDTIFSPEEYSEWVGDTLTDFSYDELVETSWGLRALANDREFLLNSYHSELEKLDRNVSANVLTPQSVTVLREPEFFVRANIWLPQLKDKVHQKSEQTLYAYELPHDHNFHFTTVGYYGDGYSTDLYSYDIDKVTGYIGEKIDLVDCGKRTLGPGDTMVYKANEDVHVQYEPKSLSVSLNLIPLGPNLFNSPQYVFDPASKTICAGVSDQVGSRIFFLDFFRHVSNDNTVSLLGDLMTKHECPRTRGMALNVLQDIVPDERDYFSQQANAATLQYARPDLVHAGYARQREG